MVFQRDRPNTNNQKLQNYNKVISHMRSVPDLKTDIVDNNSTVLIYLNNRGYNDVRPCVMCAANVP